MKGKFIAILEGGGDRKKEGGGRVALASEASHV